MKGGGRDTVNLEGNLPFGARDWKGAVDSRYCSIIIKLQFLSTHSYFCIFFFSVKLDLHGKMIHGNNIILGVRSKCSKFDHCWRNLSCSWFPSSLRSMREEENKAWKLTHPKMGQPWKSTNKCSQTVRLGHVVSVQGSSSILQFDNFECGDRIYSPVTFSMACIVSTLCFIDSRISFRWCFRMWGLRS